MSDLKAIPSALLFGEMIALGLKLFEQPHAPLTPQREQQIARYDELVAELNRRQRQVKRNEGLN